MIGRLTVGFLAALSLCVAPAMAQEGDAGANSVPEDEIRVLGQLESPDDLPVKADAIGRQAQVSRHIISDVRRFVRCAKPPAPDRLSTILDGQMQMLPTKRALHDYVVRHRGCYAGYPISPPPPPSSPYYGDCDPKVVDPLTTICQVVFERGVLFEQALEEFGGGVPLTRRETFDEDIRARFMAREEERNRYRLKLGSNYFYTVACMVQIQPEYGTALLTAEPGSDDETRLRQLLIGYGGPCMGNPKKVVVDPGQFRAYVAEAVYSWKVAVLGKPSLIAAAT